MSITPKKGDCVRGFNHTYATRILDATETQFKIKYSDHWDSQEMWYSNSLLELEVEDEINGNSWTKTTKK